MRKILVPMVVLAVACGDDTVDRFASPSTCAGDDSSCPCDDADSCVEDDAGNEPEPGYDFSALTSHLDGNLADFGGEVYVAIARDGEPLYEYAAGGADRETVFPMASATKMVSAGVVLALADDGHFGLDDRVGDYLPIFDLHGKGNFSIAEGFGMASGLYDATRPHTNRRMTLEQSVNVIARNATLLFEPPGSAIAYDGKQMQVVGRIAELTTGTDWRTVARDTLFEPCAMNDTHYDVFGDLNPAVAGGLSTTAADYLRYLRMLQSGGLCEGTRVLSEESVAAMFDNPTDDAPVLKTPWPESHPDYPYGKDVLRYGFGSWILAENPETGVVEELTSPGAWGSFPWIDARRNLYGVILTNPDGGLPEVLDTELALLSLVREAVDAVP